MFRGSVTSYMLIAGTIVAFATLLGITVLPEKAQEIGFILTPENETVTVGTTFTVEVRVKSSVPTNVFAGTLTFDPDVLSVESIDYNTSIADLWAELPWYSDGEGTVTFGGGTTKAGGFSGADTLLTVAFKPTKEGRTGMRIEKPRILLHNGLGTDATLATAKDTIFFVEPSSLPVANTISSLAIVTEMPSSDFNDDGKQNLLDLSIFMLHINSTDGKFDLNQDGEVDLKDLSILLDKE